MDGRLDYTRLPLTSEEWSDPSSCLPQATMSVLCLLCLAFKIKYSLKFLKPEQIQSIVFIFCIILNSTFINWITHMIKSSIGQHWFRASGYGLVLFGEHPVWVSTEPMMTKVCDSHHVHVALLGHMEYMYRTLIIRNTTHRSISLIFDKIYVYCKTIFQTAFNIHHSLLIHMMTFFRKYTYRIYIVHQSAMPKWQW